MVKRSDHYKLDRDDKIQYGGPMYASWSSALKSEMKYG
jgi:hypothetical protein